MKQEPSTLTKENSQVYVATRPDDKGSFDTPEAKTIRFRARSEDHAKILCKTKGRRFECLASEYVKPEHRCWHVRISIGQKRKEVSLVKLFYHNQLIESGRGKNDLTKFENIATFLNSRKMKPNKLCFADYPSLDSALKKHSR